MKTKVHCNTCKYYKQHYKYGDLIHTCFAKKSFYSEHSGDEDAQIKNKNNDCEDYEFHNQPHPKPDRFIPIRDGLDIAFDNFTKALDKTFNWAINNEIYLLEQRVLLSGVKRNEKEVFCKNCRFCFIDEKGHRLCRNNPDIKSSFKSNSISYTDPEFKNFDNRCTEYKRQAIKPQRSWFEKLKIKLKYKILRKI